MLSGVKFDSSKILQISLHDYCVVSFVYFAKKEISIFSTSLVLNVGYVFVLGNTCIQEDIIDTQSKYN